jgi:ubiquitin carboxyl-terminal hydrolase 16/45
MFHMSLNSCLIFFYLFLGGHYVAYVKVRPKITKDDPRWKFLAQGTKAELDQLDEQKKVLEKQTEKVKKRQMSMTKDSDDSLSNTSSSQTTDDEDENAAVGGSDEPEDLQKQSPPGKWYYVSDSHVREASETDVLNAQAYLLFYERIF